MDFNKVKANYNMSFNNKHFKKGNVYTYKNNEKNFCVTTEENQEQNFCYADFSVLFTFLNN